jgi:pimeloyl-ACP methyl ester carboxylesterase
VGDPPTEEVERFTVPVGLARLSCLRRGRGGPRPTVFLHAGVADQRSWTGVLERLAPPIDALSYDRRGFGLTVGQPEAHDQVRDLTAVLDAAGLEEAALVGNSRGGQIALDFALSRPERVTALVLVAPGVSGAPAIGEADVTGAEAAIWRELEAADAAGDLHALNQGELRIWLDGPEAPEGRVGGATRALAYDMNRIALAAPSPGFEPTTVDAWSRLEEIACPTLVVVGALDLSHQRARAPEVARRIAGASLEVLPGVAHLPALEAPDIVARLLRDFLDPAAQSSPPHPH